ncbi:type II secretion system minor pseudopilin GspK [Alkalilimnicola sp. S0819]|uniref:type II secretion system minor pseudopilin GspK n=1 Tax=Alkalilimnicola sp. S0819 TaxID=2613922 RepID=UPI0012622814|nr:type II secretion system minor pseudopilin GspK [Alkalilimnicola sp. S0819]KAB7622989.1 general secretion pathway protein GspK [Alkalilimnicola sp. S0819]MPQ17099.1 general secretion pathway protein GspK [Alkalilimnicola sp. S0819]
MRSARQSGIALITALLVVAVAATAAIAMIDRQQVDIRRSQNIFARDQAYAYALASESFAMDILAADLRSGPHDHLAEPWAQGPLPLNFEGADILLYLEDLQGRFNLNNLVNAAGEPVESQLQRFRNLLRLLELDPLIADAVVDWLDPNQDTRYPGGAEDDVYTRKDPAYRPANGPMRSLTELRMVEGVTPRVYERLAPLLTVLPGQTTLNINTAGAPLLASLADDLNLAQGEQLLEVRPENGFESVDSLLQSAVFAGRQVAADSLSTGSRHFELRASVELGRSRAELTSHIQRGAQGGLKILARGSGVL